MRGIVMSAEGQAEHEVVEQRVVGLHREASAAHREDQSLILAGHVASWGCVGCLGIACLGIA